MAYFRFIGVLIFCMLMTFNMNATVAAKDIELDINSESVVLMDIKSGQVLYGKNEHQRMYPASITKIATAIYAIENSDLDEIVTVSENARNVKGTRVYLEVGEQVKLEKLLLGLMVNSGNDAAVAVAEHIDGTVDIFSEQINHFLQEKVGTSATHFTNPHGLFDAEHYTTAEDMAKITQYAMKNETFQGIFKTLTYEWDGESWDTTLVTHHRLLKGEYPYDGITGGKNGYVGESGHTLVTTAENDDLELVVVTLQAYDKNTPYTDTIQLLEYGFEHYETMVIQKGSIQGQGEERYTLPEDLYFTVRKDDQFEEKVNDKGLLSILDSKGALLAEYQLEPVVAAITNPQKATMKNEKDEVYTSNENLGYLWTMVGVVIIGFMVLRLTVLKKQY